jgi:tetratricopeptide (TPR) repeat protein
MNSNPTSTTRTRTSSNASTSASKVTAVQPQPTKTDPLSQPIPLTTYRPTKPIPKSIPNPAPAPAPTIPTQKKTQTPEQEVDSFLSGPSTRTQQEEPGPLPLLKPTPFPLNLTGIQQLKALVERRAWGDVVKISAEMLMGGVSPYEKYYSQLINGNGVDVHQHDQQQQNKDNRNNQSASTSNTIIKETIQIIHWRIRALLFLRRYHDLKTEILRIRLLPSASYNDTLPDWIPLGLILEGVEATFHVNMSSADSSGGGGGRKEDDFRTEREELDLIVDNLYELRKTHNSKIEKGADGAYMHDLLKLDTVLVNILVQREEWRLALHGLDGMLVYAGESVKSWFDKDGGTDGGTIYNDNDNLEIMTKAVKIELYSRQGKILLQAGALPAAATVFERAHDLYQTMTMNLDTVNDLGIHGNDLLLIRNVKTQILMNEGLLHFAHIDYDLAEEKFRMAVESQREFQKENTNEKRAHGDLILDGGELMGTEGDLLIPCLNNLALCALYTCRMRDAVNMMEALVREDPTKYLTEVMVFNLCTLYELGSDNATSERKKRVLQSIAKRFTLHDIGPENFRLH